MLRIRKSDRTAGIMRFSTKPDVGVLHHLAPKHHLILHETAELRRRRVAYIDVELLETRGDVGITQDIVDAFVELLNDRRRCAVGDKDTIPFIGLEAGQGVRDRRNIRKTSKPALPGM